MARVLIGGLLALGCASPDVPGPPTYQGVVEFEETDLSFEVPGRVVELIPRRGERLQRGQRVASLDDGLERKTRESRASDTEVAHSQLLQLKAGSRPEEIRAGQAELEAALAQEQLLEQSLQREQQLHAAGVSPTAVLDDAEKRLQQALAQRKAAEQRLGAVRSGARPQEIRTAALREDSARTQLAVQEERLARYSLLAPGTGTVLDTHVELGEVVAAGTPVITLADPQRPYVDVFVPQQALEGIQVGRSVAVRVDGMAQRWTGRVEHLSRKTEFTPRYIFTERERPNLVIRVRIRVQDPEERLHAGIPADVEFGEAGAAP